MAQREEESDSGAEGNESEEEEALNPTEDGPPPSKKKRQSISIARKLEAVDWMKKNKNVTKAAKIYGCGRSQIKTWVKNEVKMREQMVQKHDPNKKRMAGAG